MKSFQCMVQRTGLLDLGYRSPTYTWSNNQQDSALIMQRLDIALATTDWTAQFLTAAVDHLSCFNSDHHPILLRTAPPPPRAKQAFKIENWWLQHPGFDGFASRLLSNRVSLGIRLYANYDPIHGNGSKKLQDLTRSWFELKRK